MPRIVNVNRYGLFLSDIAICKPLTHTIIYCNIAAKSDTVFCCIGKRYDLGQISIVD